MTKTTKRQLMLPGLLIFSLVLVGLAVAIKTSQRNGVGLKPDSNSAQVDDGVDDGTNTSTKNRPDSAPTEQPATQVPTDPKYSGTTLQPPTGQLLNKHSISLSSTSIETSPDENSTCQTVSGATCDIRLTGPDGTVKNIGAKAVDAAGGANFYWNAKTIGLTPGKWKVEAVATKNGQTTVSAPDTLDVRP